MRIPSILFLLQLSVKDTESRKYKLSWDSTWNYTCNIVSGLNRITPGVQHTILVPKREQLFEGHLYQDVATAKLGKRVIFQEFPYCPIIMLSRISFETENLREALTRSKYDMVWINDPCQALGIKTLLHHLGRLHNTPIVTSFNWIDTKDDHKIHPNCSYFLRQAEGAYHSDVLIFNSIAAIEQFNKDLVLYFRDDVVKDIRKKSFAIPPSIDLEIFTDQEPHIPTRSGAPVVIFNHRLHDISYYRSNWERAFDISRDLLAEGLAFRIIATDTPSKEIETRYPFLEFTQRNYNNYVSLLHDCSIAVGFFRNPGMWSMALVEAMAAGCATIIPNHSGYLEIAPPDYSAYSTGDFEADKALMKKLLCNEDYCQAVAEQGKEHVRSTFNNTAMARRLLDILLRKEEHLL